MDALPSAVALLVDKEGGNPVAVVMEPKSGDALIVQVAASVPVGVLPAPVDGQPIRVTTSDAARLAHVKALGLSLEPAGGSPQPTKVLGLGALVRLKS